MWVDVALVIAAVWVLVAAGMACAIGRAVRIADEQRARRRNRHRPLINGPEWRDPA